jgi:15-cis-phytoene synthase
MPPTSRDTSANYAKDVAACRALLRTGSRTFFAASYFLPKSIRDSATVLYAFCRLTDDAVDLENNKAEGLQRMRDRLERVYAGRPSPDPVDRAFTEVVERLAIPRALPEALLDGCEWDVVSRRYETLDELHAYAARVAGSVGAMMALVMGVREPHVVARACDLGVAMQLSNISRDVGEDARAGRLFLPLQWLKEAGIDPDAWLQNPTYSRALGSVIQRLLRNADQIYARGDAGIAHLPVICRPGIRAARILYSEIGREVERHGLDSVNRRAVVPGRKKASLLAQTTLLFPASTVHNVAAPPLEATRFLTDAVAMSSIRLNPLQPDAFSIPPWWNQAKRIARIIELLEQLEQRDQLSNAASGRL